MISAVLICSAWFAAAPAQADRDLASYEAAQATTGRDPAAQIKLALWCEAHGLQAERIKHLAIAVMTDPSNATARGLMGLVTYRGRWQRPDTVGKSVEADAELNATLAEYNARRDKVGKTADAHWQLALWCEEKGLKAEALAHLSTVVRLNPGHDAAWKRLGCKKQNGRWVTETQIAEEKAEAEAQKKANKTWRPLLAKWRADLSSRSKRAEAETTLASVDDPRAVPSVWAVFGRGDAASQTLAVQLLGQIESPTGSRYLMLLSVRGESAEVRRAATETLKRRDPLEFVPLLIGMLRDPVEYEVRPVQGPGSQGVLFVEGERFNVQRLYSAPPPPNIPLHAGEPVTYDAYGLPVISRFLGETLETHVNSSVQMEFLGLGATGNNRPSREILSRQTTTTQTVTDTVSRNLEIPIGQIMLQYQTAALAAQEQLRTDIERIQSFNVGVRESNDRVTGVLTSVLGQDLGPSQDAWSAWWTDRIGYAYTPPQSMPKPTFLQDVPPAYVPQGVVTPIQNQVRDSTSTTSVSSTITRAYFNCFKAGTPVRTLSGPRRIEALKVGDQVLTQDSKSGGLSYQPILATFHNKPSPTLRVVLGDESIFPTPIHRFWKVGHGWTMARDLKTGDSIRTLEGPSRVNSVETDTVEPVFNIEVAQGHNFFVGQAGTLVHDNSLVLPVTDPFDAAPELGAMARKD